MALHAVRAAAREREFRRHALVWAVVALVFTVVNDWSPVGFVLCYAVMLAVELAFVAAVALGVPAWVRQVVLGVCVIGLGAGAFYVGAGGAGVGPAVASAILVLLGAAAVVRAARARPVAA
ncbi:MAG: hypothetical protein ABEJ80_08685 [Halarchaeum sp.]